MPNHTPTSFRRVPLVVALVLCGGWPGALRAAVPEILYPTVRIPHQGPSQVAISNDTLVFASYNLENGTGGKAWAYRRSGEGWQLDAILRPPPSVPVDAVFGYSVAVAGDTIAVGAPPLVVYVFVRQPATGWVQQAAIPSPASEAAPNFGFRVAISGDRLLVGAPSQAHEQIVGGSAYIYRRVGGAWRREASFFDPQDNGYGSRIAIDGALAVIGSGGPIDTYLLGQHGWLRQAPVAAGNSTFSFSVSGDTLAVGGFREGISIWQFRNGGWTRQSTLPVESSVLTLDNDTLAAATTAGMVQVYRRQGRQGPWLLAATLVEPRADEAPGFAASIALSAGTVVASSDGPVWVFDKE
jgi:FG-GAP repeat protein